MSDTPNLALLVLLEAKIEYTNKLIDILLPRFTEGFESMFETTSHLANDHPDKILIVFQNTLQSVPSWGSETLDKEYSRIIKLSNCVWIDDLLSAVFICNAKILSVSKLDNKNNTPIQLNVPTSKYFIHQCYIDISRELWKNPYPIYTKNLNHYDILENKNKVHQIIRDCIHSTIRRLLPIKSLLNQFLNKNQNDVLNMVHEAKEQLPNSINNIDIKDILNDHSVDISKNVLDKSDDILDLIEPNNTNLEDNIKPNQEEMIIDNQPKKVKQDSKQEIIDKQPQQVVVQTQQENIRTIPDFIQQNNVNNESSPKNDSKLKPAESIQTHPIDVQPNVLKPIKSSDHIITPITTPNQYQSETKSKDISESDHKPKLLSEQDKQETTTNHLSQSVKEHLIKTDVINKEQDGGATSQTHSSQHIKVCHIVGGKLDSGVSKPQENVNEIISQLNSIDNKRKKNSYFS